MKTYHDVNKIFWDFVNKFDTSDPSILKKIVHTYAVANNCFDTACRFQFNEEERIFCYMIGMFHDLGRFEQWSKYKTYDDNVSENHGEIGRRIFLSEFTPELLELTQDRFNLLADTILYHIKEFSGDDNTLWKYLNIIHSADAYDNLLNTAIGTHVMSSLSDGVTEFLFEKFLNNEKIFKYTIKTKLDRILKSIANAYCISIDFMRSNVITKNYFEIIYDKYVDILCDDDKIILRQAIDHLIDTYRP